MSIALYDELAWRGFIDNTTSPDVQPRLNAGRETFYIGFDPTSDSFHIGQMAAFNLMSLMIDAGHTAIALVGGATGMIGDPSGKNKERTLLDETRLKANIAGLEKQLCRILGAGSGRVKLLNNYDWLSGFSFLEMLRDVGKNFSVNTMMARDSVASRLKSKESGITYTEFSYMVLQAYDFYYLSKHHGCTMQLGGSDQWGNILSGIDLTRRLSGKEVFGFTMPLLTKADGAKFGKSEGQTVWLDGEKTSPYDFYQFLVRQDDSEVVKMLKILTRLDKEEIGFLAESVAKDPEKRLAQKRLAEEVTRMTHGQESLDKVVGAARFLYSEDITALDAGMIEELLKDAPVCGLSPQKLDDGWLVADALAEAGLSMSKGKARQLISSGGFYLNNKKVSDVARVITRDDLIHGKFIVLRSGKKNYRLAKLSS